MGGENPSKKGENQSEGLYSDSAGERLSEWGDRGRRMNLLNLAEKITWVPPPPHDYSKKGRGGVIGKRGRGKSSGGNCLEIRVESCIGLFKLRDGFIIFGVWGKKKREGGRNNDWSREKSFPLLGQANEVPREIQKSSILNESTSLYSDKEKRC